MGRAMIGAAPGTGERLARLEASHAALTTHVASLTERVEKVAELDQHMAVRQAEMAGDVKSILSAVEEYKDHAKRIADLELVNAKEQGEDGTKTAAKKAATTIISAGVGGLVGWLANHFGNR